MPEMLKWKWGQSLLASIQGGISMINIFLTKTGFVLAAVSCAFFYLEIYLNHLYPPRLLEVKKCNIF